MPDTTTDYSTVAHFLRMDYWPLEVAALLLLGLDPRYTHIPNDQDDGKLYWLDGRPPLDCLYADTPEMLRYILKRNDLLDLWENTDHDPGELKNDKARQPYVLAWAESMGITPPWKQWAADQGLWPTTASTAAGSEEKTDAPPSDHPAKDPSHPHYAPDLHAAIAAWEALYLNGEKPEHLHHTPAATAWLEEHWPQLGPTARKRLASVINTKDNKNFGRFEEKQR